MKKTYYSPFSQELEFGVEMMLHGDMVVSGGSTTPPEPQASAPAHSL